MRNIKTTQPKKRSFIRYGYLTVGILSFIVGIIFCNLINDFNSHYSLRTPIVFQSIIVRRVGNIGQVASPSASSSAKPTIVPCDSAKAVYGDSVYFAGSPCSTPQPTISPDLQGQPKPDRLKPVTSNIFSTLKHADIVLKIYTLESSQGKNDGCKLKGLVNGFGFMQQDDHDPWMCFQNLEDVATRVDNWLDEQLAKKTLSQALCYYQSGTPSNDCGYYRKYLALK